MKLTEDYSENTKLIDDSLRVGKSFDIIKRTVTAAGRNAAFYMIDGFVKDDIMEKIMEFVMSADEKSVSALKDAKAYAERFIPYVEVNLNSDTEDITCCVLSGMIAFIIDGYKEAILIDARTYPARDTEEPDSDRVLRGSHEGFVETLVFNTALIRRRIRDPRLTMEIKQIGKKSKTDIVLCYLSGEADEAFLDKIRQKLDNLDINALTMSQETLAEALINQKWYNPFPKFRYTERPDAAAANVLEGKIIIFTDTSPSAMILPTSIFDFTQEADDYYFPPFTGTYLRILRIMVFTLTLLLTPIWYLLVRNPQFIPDWLGFIKISEPNSVPIIAQLLIIEFAIDALKLASLNTPSVLSNSFSIIGGLILGEFAVEAKWFVPEAILYMAFVSIANYSQPSFELGYAFKFMRIIILCLTAIFNTAGFVAGIILTAVFILTNKSINGKSYLYPLIPFSGHDFMNIFVRKKLKVKFYDDSCKK